MREKRTKYEGRRGTEHEGLIPVTDIVQDLTSVNIDPMVSLRSPDIQPLRCGDLRRYPLFNTEWTSRVNCRVVRDKESYYFRMGISEFDPTECRFGLPRLIWEIPWPFPYLSMPHERLTRDHERGPNVLRDCKAVTIGS